MTKLERDIENTLKSLNTIKKCRENFPDCIPYLPLDPSTSQVPVIQIADITNRLQMFK
jgi:hypothetical protein